MKPRAIRPDDTVRVYVTCIGCRQSWPFAFPIEAGLPPRTALPPACCPKCQARQSHPACTCRPVVTIDGHTSCAGIDSCPVHGFGPEGRPLVDVLTENDPS